MKAIETKVSGINAIVVGHVHNTVNDLSLKNPQGKTVPVIKPNKWGSYVSQIDLNIDSSGNFTDLITKNVEILL
ncbi:MAG: hypothetical protein PHX70_10330 [Clostridium sp.]|nr:hypothetical protein [Clostridium sp.]